MKQLFILIAMLTACLSTYAQTAQFGVVSYHPIKGWKQERTDKYVSFSSFDEARGIFCVISIYPAIDGNNDSRSNFDNSWKKIVQEPLHGGTPRMEKPATQNGWTLETGAAEFNKEGLAGIATLVTATSNNRMVNMLILINSDTYAEELQAFIGSMELKEQVAAPAVAGNQGGIAGIWLLNVSETSGYMNNMPMYTAGYFRKQYQFNSDGTYLFLEKNWSAYGKIFQFAYEIGKWTVSGNKLTITPLRGDTQEYAKAASGRSNEWGKFLKSTGRKMETVTYEFGTKYYSGSQNTSLELYHARPTERDGSSGNGVSMHRSAYSGVVKTVVDYPPGFKL